MPQMMPMMWSIMLLTTLTMLMILISLMYFIYMPLFHLTPPLYPQYTNWHWMW